MEEERVQKILAKAGFGSRRACEVFIREGKVNINGTPAHLGSKADAEKDTITVNGVTLKRKDPLLYVAVNKPRNILSDEDPNDPRESVRNLVPVSTRLFTVGRLDYDSEGLILLTNDGELANRLTHPRYGHGKRIQSTCDYQARCSAIRNLAERGGTSGWIPNSGSQGRNRFSRR